CHVDLEDLAVHAQAAGDRARAAELAAQAGEQAIAAAAFDRAARLFALALELAGQNGADAGGLLRQLGDAQAGAGRGRQAADSYLRAADLDPANAQDLRQQAAEQLLRCGDTDEGVVILKALLRPLGWRVARRLPAMLASMLARRAQLGLRGLDY